jgi:hypothetical protein
MRLGAGIPLFQPSPARPVWTHPKAVWACDFVDARHALDGRMRDLSALVTVTRSSSHLLTDADGVIRTFGHNALATVPGRGAYVGAQVANLYQNPRMIGAQVGQPLPTGAPTRWQPTGAPAGITSTVVDVGTRYGLPYFAVRFHGTALASGNQSIRPEVYNSIPMAAGQTVAQAISVRRVAGLAPTLILGIVGSNDSNVFVQSFGNVSAALTSDITRFFGSGVATAGVTRGYGQLSVPFVEGQNYDFTIEIYPPLLVVGGGVTFDPGYVLPPEGAQGVSVRMASDVRAASMDWFSAAGAGFSVLAEVDITHVGDGVTRHIMTMGVGVSTNIRRMMVSSAGLISAQIYNTATGQAVLLQLPGAVATGRQRIAVRMQPGAHRLAATGRSAVASVDATPLENLERLHIGQNYTGSADGLNDTIRRLEICHPLTDVEMDAWVAA